MVKTLELEYFTLPHLFWPDSGGLKPEFHQNPPESAYSSLNPMLTGVSANFGIHSSFSLFSIWSQSFFLPELPEYSYMDPNRNSAGLFQKFWQPLGLKPD